VRFVRCALMLVCMALGAVAEGPRVYVTDSVSWEVRGSAVGAAGGARPQTAEIIKTFGKKCPDYIITNRPERADYSVVVDREGGKGIIRKDNKVVIYNRDGDAIGSHSTSTMGGSVEFACREIANDWAANGSKPAESGSPTAASAKVQGATVLVSSKPEGADIEIDGKFVGSTPSKIVLSAGDHEVVVSRSGFKPWRRTITITAGGSDITLSAELLSEGPDR
jgi:hypothetical protein